jgi:hypothetical protein
MLTNDELNRIVGPILQKRLSSRGLKRFTIKAGEDHDGDPSLFIVAHLPGPEQELDAAALLNSTAEIREQLRKHGDHRLPYVRYKIPDFTHEVAG